jgi:hypothetical protein
MVQRETEKVEVLRTCLGKKRRGVLGEKGAFI